MSFLARTARARNVTKIGSAPVEEQIAIYKETVAALDHVLDGDQTKLTKASVKIITSDIGSVIGGLRRIDRSYFSSRDAILSNLREARKHLNDAYSMLNYSRRPGLTFFGRLNQARAFLEAAGEYF